MPEQTAYERKRAEFVETAAGMFAKDGWGVTTRELAGKGVSPVTINNGFRRHRIEKEKQPDEDDIKYDEVDVPGKDGLVVAVVAWAIERWHELIGPAVSRTAGESAEARVAAVFDGLAEAVRVDPDPFAVLARATFELRFVDPARREEEHPGKTMVRRHRRRVGWLLAGIMAPATGARLGQRRRREVADELAWLVICAGYAHVSGREQDAVTLRDAALLLMRSRLGA